MVHFNVSNIIFVDFSFNMLLEKGIYVAIYNNTQNEGDFWDQPIRPLYIERLSSSCQDV